MRATVPFVLAAAAALACAAERGGPGGRAPKAPAARSAAGRTPDAPSSSAGVAACPRPRPIGCSTKPTLEADALPILERRCYRCHAPGASFAADDHDFTDRATLRAQRARVLGKVATCAMPPDQPEALTSAEATALMQWAACGD